MSTLRPRELTRTKRLAATGANVSSDQNPDDASNEASTLVLQISLASVKEIDSLIGALKDLRTQIESRRNRIQDDIVEFAELSRSAIQVTKIVSDSVAHVQTGPGLNNSSGSGQAVVLEVVSTAATQ
jgi:hypothetical protein